MSIAIQPHGGKLVNLMVEERERETLKKQDYAIPSWILSNRQLCDLELLLCGAFSPLTGFLNQHDYESVIEKMQLTDGTLWPIPICLDIDEKSASQIKNNNILILRDQEGVPLAELEVDSIWKPNRLIEAKLVYGTTETHHPGVYHLLHQTHPYYVGGRVRGFQSPRHYNFLSLRQNPEQVRRENERQNWSRIIGFQTRNPLHRAHQEMTLKAAEQVNGHLLIHPIVGTTKSGDIDHYTRVRCYQALLEHYPQGIAKLAVLPLSMRMAGPKEAIWHALIRQNYGCTHFILGRDHASPGCNLNGNPYYPSYAAHELFNQLSSQMLIEPLLFMEMRYVPHLDQYIPVDKIPSNTPSESLSGTQLRSLLKNGKKIPHWFSYAEVIDELRKTHPPRHSRGITLFFTGLSGAGKSTLANILAVKLMEVGSRPVTLLDGDVVRKYLSPGLGFSKEDRDLNIRRIGFVATEITKNRGIAICAPIAPYEETRQEIRSMVEDFGTFILIHISTPLKVCEDRDVKGLYSKARDGTIPNFTGVTDPYDHPPYAELSIDTSSISPEKGAEIIMNYLYVHEFLT